MVVKPLKSPPDLLLLVTGDLGQGVDALMRPVAITVGLLVPDKEVFTGAAPGEAKEGGEDDEDGRGRIQGVDLGKNILGRDVAVDFAGGLFFIRDKLQGRGLVFLG